MIGRIVEIAGDSRHLSVHRGFLVVESRGEEVGRVPLDDIAAVVANAHGITYSNNLVVALSKRAVPLVVCGPNHVPVAFLWPVEGNHRQATRMDAQLRAPRALQNRLWRDVVRAKILFQADALNRAGRPFAPVAMLARRVKPGDPENVESQAARRYWPLMFGPGFRRDRRLDGPNAQLNYGYTVLRSAAARAVMAAGLHPTLAIHHRNRGNPMRLVDDLMEPFRPLVDLMVLELRERGEEGVSAEAKRLLAHVAYRDLRTRAGVTPLMTCLERLAASLALVYEGERQSLDLPRPLAAAEAAPAE